MTKAALQSLPGSKDGLVRKYIDKAGKRRHAGVPDRLKNSQSLCLEYLIFKNGISGTRFQKDAVLDGFVSYESCDSTCQNVFVILRSYTRNFGQFIAGLATTELKAGNDSCIQCIYIYI